MIICKVEPNSIEFWILIGEWLLFLIIGLIVGWFKAKNKYFSGKEKTQ